MDQWKSLEEVVLLNTLIYDVFETLGEDFNTRAIKQTQQKVCKRTRYEGISFLTKTLPRLGKHLDKVLNMKCALNPASVGFDTLPGSKLPRFLGELFSRIFQPNGELLPSPDASCVKSIRQITYAFYKYALPYDESQEQQVIDAFVKAENDLSDVQTKIASLQSDLYSYITPDGRFSPKSRGDSSFSSKVDAGLLRVVREARILLSNVFARFDGSDISPCHGPGVVATGEKHSGKFHWTNVCSRITDVYPLDAYFYASAGHVCDSYTGYTAMTDYDLPARVILVPKDSRGPRLISCEPVDFQWIQQGLRKAIYRLVESHPTTKWNVFFTDQGPNQRGALLGSSTGRYATLDLKEASDRVSLDLVRLLFPEHVFTYLECCRSGSTVLPSGERLNLRKFAPMGSALCFPIMALTIWALLTASAPDADTREGILVYGDDVIVPTAFAEDAMTVLESFGLKINHDKSFTQGPFRESCGVDAFKGVDVTPVRFRTRWDKSQSADAYASWIEYANSLYAAQYYNTYDLIVSWMETIYGPIPGEDSAVAYPSFIGVSHKREMRTRNNKKLQKKQTYVRVVISPVHYEAKSGWEMLLRYFTEGSSPTKPVSEIERNIDLEIISKPAFSVREYTRRHTGKLVWRWR